MLLVQKAMIGMVLVACMACNWMLALSMCPLSGAVSRSEGDGGVVIVGNDGHGPMAALQGESLSVSQCSSPESGFYSISVPKKLRSHCSSERLLPSAIFHRCVRCLDHPLFSKTGIAYVSSRANNYYVFALRHLLC